MMLQSQDSLAINLLRAQQKGGTGRGVNGADEPAYGLGIL
jgi:hypothetical protein